MAFDFSNITGEAFGDINDVFFKKDGKSILPETVTAQEKVSVSDIAKNISELAQKAEIEKNRSSNGTTLINISKDILGTEDDIQIILSDIEERRRAASSVRNRVFIDLDNGEEIIIQDQTELYNGTNLFSAQHTNTGKIITYPRGMFVGKTKRFVPKDFYIREAERAIEDTIEKFGEYIFELVQDQQNFSETTDGKYLEIVLDTPLNIMGGMQVPDKVQIPVKRMFDMGYKILMLESVICLDNKIAALLFNDIWF